MELWLQGAIAILAAYGVYVLLSGIAWRRFALRTARLSLSVILIVKNQADRIEGWVGEMLDARRAVAGRIDIDLVVVDDRSTDQTAAILDRLARANAGLQVVRMDQILPGSTSPIEAGAVFSRGPVCVVANLAGGSAQAALRTLRDLIAGAAAPCPRSDPQRVVPAG